jgi:hypothetical protein
MAISKNTRRTTSDTNKLFQTFFDRSQVSEERERAWKEATLHVGTGTPPLRFPIYEKLYFINVYSEKLVDLVREITGKFGIHPDQSLYHQSLIQQLRAGISNDVVAYMDGIEITEEWLFGCLRREAEKSFQDPDDIYLAVRDREKERVKEGLPPLIRFLDKDHPPATKRPTGKLKTIKAK